MRMITIGKTSKNFPMSPSTKNSGEKATMVVRTAKTTGLAISWTPTRGGASRFHAPFLVRVNVLSRNDRVVHHDAEHHDEGEERKHVDRGVQETA